ncbi:MAG TPA: hypothetical protein VLG49_01405, partial [Rhabdochlamydiaceae bacterium]|nr:hypothetical protein [Rhabdochlamydiaceae bacterium]
RYLLNISSIDIDPKSYLPLSLSYKEGLRLVLSRILDEDTYQYYLGAKVEPAPRIPEEISLKRFNEPDPFDPTETIGQNYFWMYSPPNLEIEGTYPFYLNKLDDPNDQEAPMLVNDGPIERLMKLIGLGAKSAKRVLKVPNTINNSGELFKYPKNGNPSAYNYIWSEIARQHGNKRIPSGWICMREKLIGRNLSFSEQKAVAKKAGVVIPALLHRINFNFLQHARSGREDVYPDGRNPEKTAARTSTLTHWQGHTRSSCCGGGGPSGLCVGHDGIDDGLVGEAVALSAETQVIGP